LHLGRIGLVDLPRQLYGTVVVPTRVQTELGRLAERFGVKALQPVPSWIEPRALTDATLLHALREENLDDGESEAIALAVECKADLLLIDEHRGRAAARRRGISVIGVCGMLVEGKSAGRVAAVAPLLDQLARGGFRLADELRLEVLESADELI
jgi:predicted nucleic acid-binding protein